MRKEMERKVLMLIEDKTNLLRNEVAREANLRYENIEHLKSCLEVILSKIIKIFAE
jgi:hypothetical protein